MKTLVIGAHGKIGRILCRKAADHGLALRAMVRDRGQLPAFIQDKLDEIEGPHRDSFERARAAGVRLATGTDAR